MHGGANILSDFPATSAGKMLGSLQSTSLERENVKIEEAGCLWNPIFYYDVNSLDCQDWDKDVAR